MKKMLVSEDEYALSTERQRLADMKERFAKEIASYDAEKADATNKIIEIDKKYDTMCEILSTTFTSIPLYFSGENDGIPSLFFLNTLSIVTAMENIRKYLKKV